MKSSWELSKANNYLQFLRTIRKTITYYNYNYNYIHITITIRKTITYIEWTDDWHDHKMNIIAISVDDKKQITIFNLKVKTHTVNVK